MACQRRQPRLLDEDCITVVVAFARYRRHVEVYYFRSGEAMGEQHGSRSALRCFKELYADALPEDFSPGQA